MLGQNDAFTSSLGTRTPLQGGRQEGGSPLRHGGEALPHVNNVRAQNYGANVNPPNGTYDPEDELDETDSEFENDSELDHDSDQENEAIVHNNLQQNSHNFYSAPQTFTTQSVSDTNYSAINALSQLSGSLAPTYNMPSQSAIHALSTVTPNFNIPTLSANDSNHNAVNALSQLSGAAHWQPSSQPAQSNSNGNYVNEHRVHQNNSHNNGGTENACDRNGNGDNEDDESDDEEISDFGDNDSEIEDEENKSVENNYQNSTPNFIMPHQNSTPNFKVPNQQNTPNRIVPNQNNTPNRIVIRSSDPSIRPRIQLCRREVGVDMYQMQRREIEGNITADEYTSASTVTSTLKRLKLARPNFLKFSQLFQRNKTSTTDSTFNTLHSELRDSVGTQSNPELERMNHLQRIKTSEALLTPSDNASIWMNTELDIRPTSTGENTSSSYEKSIQGLLFRSNFPDHFVGIRLLKLSIVEVQQIIRQVHLFENVQEKLTEIVAVQSLSGPALMSCDLTELRKVLDLNLGHWTIFAQLIAGLRHIQTNELLKWGIEKESNLDEGQNISSMEMIHKNVFEDDTNTQSSNLISESQRSQLIGENIKDETSKESGSY